MAVLGLGVASPTFATDIASTTDARQSTLEVKETDDSGILRFGQNLFIAGNNLSDASATKGIIFSAGNQLTLQNKSEYAFTAGNLVDISATTEKDLFAAGNAVKITNNAKIGRDAFIAGNSVTVEADLPGNLAVTADTLTLRNVKIAGNVDLAVSHVIFEGKVEITGKLSFNEDADVSGLSNATYAEIEKYEVVEYTITSAEIWTGRILSIIGLFITIVIIMAMFPAMDKRVKQELSLAQFGKDLVIGIVTLFGVPFIILFLLISFFAAPAGLVLLAVYIVMLYLAQGFTGLYLGKVIFEQLFKGKMNKFIEALVGIAIIILLGIISPLINLLAIILGLGLFMQSIKPDRKNSRKKSSQKHPSNPEDIEEAQIAETKSTKDSETTKTSAKKSSTKTSSSDQKTDATTESGPEVKEED